MASLNNSYARTDRNFKPADQVEDLNSLLLQFRTQVTEQSMHDAEVMALLKTVEDEIGMIIKRAPVLRSREPSSLLKPTVKALAEVNKALTVYTEFMRNFTVKSSQSKPKFFSRPKTSVKEKQCFIVELENQLRIMKQTSRDVALLDTIDTQARLQRDIGYLTRQRCRGNEHASTLSSIRAWATSPLEDGKNILWLRIPADHSENGVHIVTTLHDEFEKARQRGGHVFFPAPPTKDKFVEMIKRGNSLPHYSLPQPAAKSTNRNPYDVIQTLAAQLAEHDLYPPLTEDIVGRLEANPRICERWPHEQFEELLLRPLLANAPTRPVVFLLDGLDHCGADGGEEDASNEREALAEVLGVLVKGSARFPPNVRLLLSGGEGKTIRRLLDRCDRVMQLEVPAAELAVKHATAW
ncbi:hypothetical protein C8R46DRAFT_1184192 [Mycena filopes]|nr:hypothetical protein C8R46DRAFT_1184192 [Mycena filopes]